jgi:hypothetical protein
VREWYIANFTYLFLDYAQGSRDGLQILFSCVPSIVTWLIIMGSGFGDSVYWHFFAITVDYISSHIELLLKDVCMTNLSLISDWSEPLELKVEATLRLKVTQSVSPGVHLGITTRYLLLFYIYGLVFLWGALSDERTGLSFVRVIICSSKSFVIM